VWYSAERSSGTRNIIADGRVLQVPPPRLNLQTGAQSAREKPDFSQFRAPPLMCAQLQVDIHEYIEHTHTHTHQDTYIMTFKPICLACWCSSSPSGTHRTTRSIYWSFCGPRPSWRQKFAWEHIFFRKMRVPYSSLMLLHGHYDIQKQRERERERERECILKHYFVMHQSKAICDLVYLALSHSI
jgi:hypothetical protein